MLNVNVSKQWFSIKMSIAADANYPAEVLWLSDIELGDNGDCEGTGWEADESKAIWLPTREMADRIAALEQMYETTYGDGLLEKIEIVVKTVVESEAAAS